MAKKDLMSSLQQIASESVSGAITVSTKEQELIDTQDIAKIKQAAEVATKMYPNNPASRFNYWKKNINIDGMSNNARNEYWKTYQNIHPRGIEGAQSDFVNVTLNEINLISGVSNKEFFLRDRLDNSPTWARSVLEPELAKLSTTVANANLSKANQVYSKSLSDKVNNFILQNDLDPDVSVEQHTADFVRLEQLNLFDVANVVNGRIGIYGQDNQFIPGFAVENRQQVFPKDQFGAPSFAEQVLVRDSAINPIKQAVDMKLSAQRSAISRQERQSAMEATKLLEQGFYTLDRWGEAFSINAESNPQDQIIRGLKGEIASKRITNEQELAESIYTAMSKYPTMFGDLNGTTE
jgi:hypothetical protein